MEDFCIYVPQGYWSFFSCGVFVWFQDQSNAGLINEFGSVNSSSIFWKSLRRIRINYPLNIWLKSPVKPSGLGLFFVGRGF